MIRKLNVPTAILLVACLTLAPTTLAADDAPRAWFSEIIATVTAWVTGGDDLATESDSEPTTSIDKEKPMLECEPGGEAGPIVDPYAPGC